MRDRQALRCLSRRWDGSVPRGSRNGKTLLADEEAGVRQRRVGGEGQRERDFGFAAVGPARLAREIEAREVADVRRP